MFKKLSEVIPFKVYPVAVGGFAWRLFDGKIWHSCTRDGKILD